jgi:HAD superfamily hydrolase (TIGR01509 family)
VDTLAARAGRPVSAAFVYNWAFATAHAFLRDLKPVPFVHRALEEFKARRLAMAVASQSPLARVQLSLRVARFDRHFGPHVYVTSMVARPKPAPDIYLHAAARLGAAPAQCIVIEDSPAAAAAALGVGMRVIGYAPERTFEAMQASGASVLRSMDELVARVGALDDRH